MTLNKHLDPCLGASPKTCFWPQFLFLFFLLFSCENVKKAYFNQHLECVAPNAGQNIQQPQDTEGGERERERESERSKIVQQGQNYQ